MGLDPRELIIKERLKDVRKVIAVVSPKGGVGKTLISTALALTLSRRNLNIGLLDLDITNPTAHLVLGIDINKLSPKEEKGVIPPIVAGIKFMTIAYYSKDEAIPLRGHEIVDVIREILAITIWGKLDHLIVDTPPGLSDEVLEILRLVRPEVLIVTTPSPLSLKSCERLIRLLKDSQVRIIGLVENMSFDMSTKIIALCNQYNIKYLGRIPFIKDLDNYVSRLEDFIKCKFMEYLKDIVKKITL